MKYFDLAKAYFLNAKTYRRGSAPTKIDADKRHRYKVDEFVKSRDLAYFVIPVQTGIQSF